MGVIDQRSPAKAAARRIRFLPGDIEGTAPEGATVLDAARAADVFVDSICGGDGSCGKCRVIVREGKTEGGTEKFLTPEEVRKGYILACCAEPRSDLVIEVPPESRLVGYGGGGKTAERCRNFDLEKTEPRPSAPIVEAVNLALSAPTLDDTSADLERLLAEVAKRRGRPAQAGLEAIRRLPRVLRRLEAGRHTWSWTWNGCVTATVAARGETDDILAVEPGNAAVPAFGIALDIGTTTVEAHLVDLATGLTRDAADMYNSQIRFGADVIARINHARRPGGAESLRKAIVQDVDALIETLVRRAGIKREDVLGVVAAGNTVMTHLFLGLETDLIRISPFVPAAATLPPVAAEAAGIRIHPRGLLYTMPMAGSYVGGDITAGVLASGMHQSDELALLLDIGTNGEVVLGNRDFLVTCSASAGPAFEGGSISCGMRAAPGAIDTVRIGRDLSTSVTTIDQAPPVGLCGTGLIDALAEMYFAGLVDRAGHIQPHRAPDRFRAALDDGRPEFILAAGATGRDIVISQADIDNLIRAKASIYAAADALASALDLSFRDIQRIYIAGAFGNHLDVARCVVVGLLPDVPADRMRFIGNSSVGGAKLVLRDRRRMDEVRAILERMTYRELMVDAKYMERFTSACFLPHTDLSRFPSVTARMQEGAIS